MFVAIVNAVRAPSLSYYRPHCNTLNNNSYISSAFAKGLAAAAGDSSNSGDVRKYAVTAIKQAAKGYPVASQQYLQLFMPPLIAAVKDINIRVRKNIHVSYIIYMNT